MIARLARTLAVALVCLSPANFPHADAEYYHHVFFDNSLTPDSYFYSSGKASAPSRLALLGGKLPVEAETFFTPPNALRLEWNSQPGGGWVAQVEVIVFRNRQIHFHGDTLSFWCFTLHGIPSEDLPAIWVADTQQGFSGPVRLAQFSGALPTARWVNVKIPLRSFVAASLSPLDSSRLRSIVFSQAAADGVDHVLILDQITIDSSDALAPSDSPSAPQRIKATGFERHIDVSWKPVSSALLQHYVIYRSFDQSAFVPIGIQEPGLERFTDFLGKVNQKAWYKVAAFSRDGRLSPLSPAAVASTRPLTDNELLTMLQEECFRYYWESAGPHSGMARENVPGDDRILATGATGFGIMALIVGVNRGFVTRAEGIK